MEMERINDDTFLLRIENQDLIDRGTSIPELLGNPGEIEGFFHSILEEMGVLNQFEDSDGLSFQIMPNPDGLELYVTRIVDMGDESTDERMVRNIVDTIQHSLTDRIGKKRKEDKEEGKISPKPVINTEDKSSTLKPIDVTVVFEDFEDFVSMAKEAS
ncbi:MAG: adaptor protein MecA, partial [Streptococcus sp.]|nr:adaptor protein MecA [Streptococcus sp.]